jgi:hypothetical protein
VVMIHGLSTSRFVMLSERYPIASVLALHDYPDAAAKFIHGGIGSWRNIVDIAVVLCGNDQHASRVVRPPTRRDESDDLWVTIKNVALPAVDAEIICPSRNHAKWAKRIAVHSSPQSNPVQLSSCGPSGHTGPADVAESAARCDDMIAGDGNRDASTRVLDGDS